MSNKVSFKNKLNREKLPIIILMSRWHAFNRCKKRLSADIGSKSAAEIQKKLTEHTISVAHKLKSLGIAEVKMAISGIGPNAAKRWAKSHGIEKISLQGAGKLGERMKKERAKLQSKNLKQSSQRRTAIFIGTDLPSICHIDLLEAVKALKNKDLVIGPAKDGGYWLIGLSGELLNPLCTWPFCGISWGTKHVLEETLLIAKSRGVNYELLRHQNDLDKAPDLSPWQNNLLLL